MTIAANRPNSFRVRLLKKNETPETPRWLSPYGTFAFTLEAAGVFDSGLAVDYALGHLIAEYNLIRPGYTFPTFEQVIEPVGPPKIAFCETCQKHTEHVPIRRGGPVCRECARPEDFDP